MTKESLQHLQMLEFHQSELDKDLVTDVYCQCCIECSDRRVKKRAFWLWVHLEHKRELHVNHLCETCCEDMKKYSKSEFEWYYEKNIK